MTDKQLRADGISRSYKSTEVLHSVSLTLEPGKIYGLIGRNGAGKTTLLSILSAQNYASAGAVTLGDAAVWENRESLSHICFARELNISADSGLSSIKLKEYLRIASCCYTHWDGSMAARLLRDFDLNPKKQLSQLSKGMLSMVTILVALCSKADYTFLDEPAAGLDSIARENFYRLLLDEYTETGRTFVLSTHIIDEAAYLMEDVLILKEGSLIYSGSTQSLMDRCFHVSGRIEDVDAAVNGLHILHPETFGRSKSVSVLLEPGEEISGEYGVSVQPMSLQKIFSSLCGKDGDSHEKPKAS